MAIMNPLTGPIPSASGDLTDQAYTFGTKPKTEQTLIGDTTSIPSQYDQEAQVLILNEISSTPATKTNAGKLYVNSSNNLIFLKEDGTPVEVATFDSTSTYGEIYTYENAEETVIDAQNSFHAIRTLDSGRMVGFTFQSGVREAISAFASGSPIETIVTSASHALNSGDYITITGTTNYEGIYKVQWKETNTFNILKEFAGDDAAGFYTRGTTLIANNGTAGIYQVVSAFSASAASSNKIFEFNICQNTVDTQHIAAERKFATTDVGSITMAGLLSVSAGDRIFFAVKNETDAANLTIKYGNININRI